jgi:LEA14-like dessication related protein
MDVRARLLGSKPRIAATVLVVLIGVIGGAFALGVVGAPGVVAVDNSFGPVTNETTVVNTDLVVNNPNPIGVRLGGTEINYTVKMNDVPIAAGDKSGLDVDRGNTTLPFSTEMRNEQIPPWWVSHVRNDEVTNVTIDATVRSSLLGNRNFDIQQRQQVETDIIGQFNSDETRPVNGPSNPLYSNPVLYVNETRGEWGEVTASETPIPMEFVVYNPQLEPYTVTEVGYAVTMNGVAVGEGVTERPYVIEGGATKTIETTPVIRNERLDDWWVTHLENDQVTQLRIDFYARVELPTGTEIRVPLNELAYERTIETDIFGNKEGPGTDGATDDGDAVTPTSEGAATDDGTATATPTDGGTTSPTDSPTPTPTNDGLL